MGGQHRPAPEHGSVQPITDSEFELFQSHVYRVAGINLGEHKRALVMGRLYGRLRKLGLETYSEYYEQVQNDPEEHERMLDRICTNETHFFREPSHFRLLEEVLIPRWREDANQGLRPRELRIWSAACSTGEEPYSLAMVLLEKLPAWKTKIVASDLSSRVLQEASRATWPIEKAEEIPAHYRKRFMLRGVRGQAGSMRAAPEIRALIQFSRLNLNDENYPFERCFDAIFCRNVLIYFSDESKARVFERIFRLLTPSGLLFLGHAETLSGIDHPLRSIIPTVYENQHAAKVHTG